ncbi:MAG TPA: class I SAM-dependent methyltransferase [Gemmataceae bacterium]|nr:class I SAM-dependent methyltransferase [Gemmataceae bacterium]
MAAALSSSVNYWPQTACAKAFWGQQELPPYRKLLADTVAWLEPKPGQHWLDLGCGCGQLTQAIWMKSEGTVAEIIGLDCAAENEKAFRKLRQTIQPPPLENRIRFVCSNFSHGLDAWKQRHFDGIVSGLAIQYAESYSKEKNSWTTEAYDHLLAEIFRILKPGGTFIFSVNVPEPAWSKVAMRSLKGFFTADRPFRYLKKSMRMMRYGRWLSRQARQGRFHYLPREEILKKLAQTGFASIEHRRSYAMQAYIFRCRADQNLA